MPRTPTFTEAARRVQIVSAAIRAIAEHGFARASFVRIAERAGISPGLITYHFRTKDQLIKAALAQIHANFDAAMSAGPEPAGYVEALSGIITGYVRHCADRPDEAAALQEISVSAGPGPLQDFVSEIARAGDAELVGFLVEGQRDGEFRAFTPEVVAAAILTILRATPRRLRDPGVDPEREGREIATLFEHAVRATDRTSSGSQRDEGGTTCGRSARSSGESS